MLNIEYGIALTDEGRPYIDLPDDYDHKIEDRFFALEIAHYLLVTTLKNKRHLVDAETINAMEVSIEAVGTLSDEVAKLIYGSMKVAGDAETALFRYSFQVETMDELLSLGYTHILHDNKIFIREEGLKVWVKSKQKIYVLIGGIDNENWEVIE
jgi:hypothetical protein